MSAAMTPTPDKDAVLAAINDLRAELDLPPLDALPRGTPRSIWCPVAKALEFGDYRAAIFGTEWKVGRGFEIKKQGVLYAFIDAFDRGAYPDLIEGRAA